MSLVLTKRSTNGAPLTATQNDANMTAIESAVNGNTATFATKADSSALSSAFTSFTGAKGNVDWVNVISKPAWLNVQSSFKVLKTDAAQSVSSSDTVIPNFGTINFNNNGLFNAGSGLLVAPFAGLYHVGTSVQVALGSGSPSAVSIIVNLLLNGVPVECATFDNTGTGTRIYKINTLLNLSPSNTVGVSVDFDFTGTAAWEVQASNTNFWGRHVYST